MAAEEFGSQPRMIAVAAGSFTPPDGQPVTYRETSFPAYYDEQLARAWAAEAVRLANDEAAIAALDVPFDQVTAESGRRQADYIYRCFDAIAQYYNAIATPWQNDPEARALYREQLAGAPEGATAADREYSQFALEVPYKRGWYEAAYPWPQLPTRAALARLGGTVPPLGRLPQIARAGIERFGGANANNTLRVVQLAGLYIDSVDPAAFDPRSGNVQPVNAAPTVRNRAFAMSPGGLAGVGPVDVSAGDDANQCAMRLDTQQDDPSLSADVVRLVNRTANQAVEARFVRGIMFGGIAYPILPLPPTGARVLPNGTRIGDVYATDWRAAAFDESLLGAPLKVAAPLRECLPWLRAWAASLAARTPAQVIVASHLYTVYINTQQYTKNASFIDRAIRTDPALYEETRRPDATANAIFTGIQTAGSVAATTGPVGAIVALAATVVATVGRVINSAMDHPIEQGHKRDDLGAFKPYISRAALGGNAGGASPFPPQLPINAPEGFRRFNPIIDIGETFNPASVETPPPVVDLGLSPPPANRLERQATGPSTGVLLAAGVGIAALVYLGSRGKSR